MRIGSLFSGIGGLELGLEQSGLGHTVWQVEQSQYCRDVLARHWPGVAQYDDVCKVGSHKLEPAELICGGFPCQDISGAGKGAGLAGARSGLWYEFLRIVEECNPRVTLVENVASGGKRWVDSVRGDLERAGYATLPVPLSARDCGAPHERARIFIIGITPNANRHLQPQDEYRWPERSSRQGETRPGAHRGWSVQPGMARVSYGLPGRVDREKALGNAVVPQCAEVIGHIIQDLLK